MRKGTNYPTMEVKQNTLYLTTPGSYVSRDHLTLRIEVQRESEALRSDPSPGIGLHLWPEFDEPVRSGAVLGTRRTCELLQ